MNIKARIENFMVIGGWMDERGEIIHTRVGIGCYIHDALKTYCDSLGCSDIHVEDIITGVENHMTFGSISLAFLYNGKIHLIVWEYWE